MFMTWRAAWAKLPQVVASLLAEGVSARDIAAVISRELGALTRQAAVIAEARMRDAGHGDPICPYAVAVLGSAGRSESLLAMDQDNALVFADGAPDGPEDIGSLSSAFTSPIFCTKLACPIARAE